MIRLSLIFLFIITLTHSVSAQRVTVELPADSLRILKIDEGRGWYLAHRFKLRELGEYKLSASYLNTIVQTQDSLITTLTYERNLLLRQAAHYERMDSLYRDHNTTTARLINNMRIDMANQQKAERKKRIWNNIAISGGLIASVAVGIVIIILK